MPRTHAHQKTALSPRFRFEPGTYGDATAGRFIPSIACLQQMAPGQWDYHFVLVRPGEVRPAEAAALTIAEKDLAQAFQHQSQIGSDQAVGEYLRHQGYVSVADFRIMK